jgi:hypothetical protein
MPQQELVRKVIEVLDRIGIPYMVTGSVVSSVQGEPRSTHDIDLVIVITIDKIPALIAAFPPPDYYLSSEAIREAIALRSTFNLISSTDGLKVDFWLLTDEPFDRSRFARRRRIQIENVSVMGSTPEDTILMKLRWAKMLGRSEKQSLDALRVYEVQYNSLDQNYLNEWARRLDLEEDFEELKNRAAK